MELKYIHFYYEFSQRIVYKKYDTSNFVTYINLLYLLNLRIQCWYVYLKNVYFKKTNARHFNYGINRKYIYI